MPRSVTYRNAVSCSSLIAKGDASKDRSCEVLNQSMPADTFHRIRLAGPWDCVWGDPPQKQRIRIPCRWDELPANASEQFLFQRSFHAPTGLLPHQRVYLEFRTAPESVWLDGCLLEFDQTGCRCEVTGRLDGFHQLGVSVSGPPGLSKPVYIVIDESAANLTSRSDKPVDDC